MASSNNRINISINGKEIANEIGAIEKAYRDLYKQSKNLVIGSDEYNANIEELGQLKSVLTDHRNAISGIDKGYALTGSTLKSLIGMTGLAFGADAVITYGREVMRAGVELTALERKAKIVFAETLPAVTHAAEQNATAMGLTAAQYTKAAAEVGDLLIPMGFTRDAASQMSIQLTNLGGVLSEWSGGTRTASETTEILRKALLGERDALEGLGIQITEEQVKTELQKKGYEDLTGKALEQAKALVTLDMIMAKSTDAQTAYANGQDSLTRKSAEMSAAFERIKEDLGRILIPLFASITAVIAPVISSFGSFISEMKGVETQSENIKVAVEAERQALGTLVNRITSLNENNETRKVLIDELQKKYPAFLGNLNAEKVTNEQLGVRLQEVNKQYLAKIVALEVSKEVELANKNEARSTEQLGAIQVREAKALADAQDFLNNKTLTYSQVKAKLQDRINQGVGLFSKERELYSQLVGASNSAASAQSQLAEYTKSTTNATERQSRIVENLKKQYPELSAVLDDYVNKTKKANEPKSGGSIITPDRSQSTTDSKDAEKAAKELEKKLEDITNILKKHQDDLKLLDSQALKDIAATYDNRIALAETALEREDLAKRKAYELDLQRDTEAIAAKYQKDIEKEQELAKDKEQKVSDAAKAAIIKLDELRDKEIKILRDEREKKRTEEEAKQAADRAKAVAQAEFDSAEESRKFLEQRAKEAQSAQKEVNKFLMLGENKEQTFAEEVNALDAHYKELLAKADEYGLNVTGLKEKYESELANIDKKYKDKEIKSEREKNTKKLELQSQLYGELGNLAGGLSELFQAEGEKQSNFQKVLVLAQIAFDTASAISSLVAASSKNPANAVTSGIAGALQYAAGIAQILSGINRAKNLFKEAPEVKRQKFTGGFESVTGATDGKTYNAQHIGQTSTGLLNYQNPVITPSGVLANEKGMEYYVSATDLRKPVVMNHVRAIEAIRTNTYPQRAEGGAVATSTTTPSVSAPDNTVLISVLMKQNELLTQLLTQGVQAKVSDRTILDIEDRFQTLNNLSNSFYRN